MNKTLRRVSGAVVAGGLVVAGSALPARALGITLSRTVHLEDCRSVALARQAGWDFDFSSNATGPLPVHLAAAADASIELCYSVDVKPLTTVDIVTETWVTAEGVVNGLLTGTDGSKVCTALKLAVAPGVKGTVSATSSAHVLVDGAPPVEWDHTFAKDVTVDTLGENISLRMCADTSGNITAS
jgi:hypothetical protein